MYTQVIVEFNFLAFLKTVLNVALHSRPTHPKLFRHIRVFRRASRSGFDA